MRPSGTVTFVFTDIEGSTRRWEADPDAMRAALAAHDEVLRSAIEVHGGWLFKHTGDGVCAAFGSPRGAIDAAIQAQRGLGLPVRMGIATGEAELRGDDYFGPALNRAARVMAAGHGGQILVAASTAGLVSGVGLVGLGERRLRDLSGAVHLFQVRAEGLGVEFPPLRTLDATPGNLAVQSTSFVGRQAEVKELCELVRGHRLVTLTGVGGVGKTRLAVQVAAELTGEFADGVWLVELALVGDPAAVADAVATTLGVMVQAGLSAGQAVAQVLSGRRLLLIVDNCEHVLDAAADVVETILGRTSTVTVLVTSREGLGVAGEQLWPVPSLDVGTVGAASAAVELFVERARLVKPGFTLDEPGDATAVREICGRLDGIALAIELAAARMVAMNPVEVLERLSDRFRLLSGGRRGVERHQTLRHAVGWSYDLLDAGDRAVLCRCSVFAGGFDLAAAVALNEGVGEYAVLDGLESLVRKSLVTTSQVGGHSRYAMLETIRQFAEEQLAVTAVAVRDRHAAYYADQAVGWWERWDGPDNDMAGDWVEVEFANLRAGFRWATDQGHIDTATAIAAHTAMLTFALQRYEPVGWAEEILDAAATAHVAQLPRLYTAAGWCAYTGRPEAAVRYAQTATALEADGRYDPFEAGWPLFVEAEGHFYVGQLERPVEIFTALAAQTGSAHVYGLCVLTARLPLVGRAEEAMSIAEEAVTAARHHANPLWIALALYGRGRACVQTDPLRALDSWREALTYTRTHRIQIVEATIARELAGLEAVHGDIEHALDLFDFALDSFHHASSLPQLVWVFARLARFFNHAKQPEIAATLHGATTHQPPGLTTPFANLTAFVDHLRTVLGDNLFDTCTATGATMELSDAVAYAHHHIHTTRTQHTTPP